MSARNGATTSTAQRKEGAPRLDDAVLSRELPAKGEYSMAESSECVDAVHMCSVQHEEGGNTATQHVLSTGGQQPYSLLHISRQYMSSSSDAGWYLQTPTPVSTPTHTHTHSQNTGCSPTLFHASSMVAPATFMKAMVILPMGASSSPAWSCSRVRTGPRKAARGSRCEPRACRLGDTHTQ